MSQVPCAHLQINDLHIESKIMKFCPMLLTSILTALFLELRNFYSNHKLPYSFAYLQSEYNDFFKCIKNVK
jgi:hypothetical protein